jgi:hypothetical protein
MSSSTNPEEEDDEYTSCGSRTSSVVALDVDMTPQPQTEKPGWSPLPNERFSPAGPTPPVPTGGGGDSIFSQLLSWLKLGGFHIGPDLPAAFEVDNNKPHDRDGGTRHEHKADTERRVLAGPVHKQGQAYVCGLRHDIFQNLMDSTRQMLARHSTSTKHSTSPPASISIGSEHQADHVYTVGDEDLECVVAHVVRVMETLHHATMLSLRGQDRNTEATSGERTSTSTAIMPRLSKTAPDTATTISFPQSYITPFTSTGQLTPQSPLVDITTLLTRGSITSNTEIDWIASDRAAAFHHVDPDVLTAASSGSHSPAETMQGTSASAGGKHGKRRGSVFTSTLPTPDTLSENRRRSVSAAKTYAEANPSGPPSHSSSESQIMSFPALKKRHCTNDWLIPPAGTPGPDDSPAKADLYALGIDAHTGASAYMTQPNIQKLPLTPAIEASNFMFRTPSYAADALKTAEVPHKVGASIGTSTGRRLSSSHTVALEPSRRRSSIFWKLGRGSVQIGHASGSVVGSAGVGNMDTMRRSSSVEMMRAILEKATAAESGRRETVAHAHWEPSIGRSSLLPLKPCSEDGRPHICTDDHSRFSSYTLVQDSS